MQLPNRLADGGFSKPRSIASVSVVFMIVGIGISRLTSGLDESLDDRKGSFVLMG